MKKVLILAGISGSQNKTDYENSFGQAISEYEFKQVYLDDLSVEVSPQKFEVMIASSKEPISNYDLVMIREYSGQLLDLAFVISKYLKTKKIDFFNHNYLIYRPLSKIAQAVLFYEQGVNFPRTFFSIKPDNLVDLARSVGYPLILKDRLGMHGSHNYLAKTSEEALTTLRSNTPVIFVAQEFIPNECDYRILVMGDVEPLQIKRTAAAGSHLNNTSQGGKGELVESLPNEILNLAKKLAVTFKINIAGVDVVKSLKDGQIYFLEVNNQPQLVTGAEVAVKLAKFKDFLKGYFDKAD